MFHYGLSMLFAYGFFLPIAQQHIQKFLLSFFTLCTAFKRLIIFFIVVFSPTARIVEMRKSEHQAICRCKSSQKRILKLKLVKEIRRVRCRLC